MVKLLNSTEVAEWVGVPVGTLNNWAYQHKGPPYVRVGRHRRYDPARVQAWIDSQTRGGDGCEGTAA